MKVEVLIEDASALFGDIEEVQVDLPSPVAPAVSGESSPTQDSGDTEQQR